MSADRSLMRKGVLPDGRTIRPVITTNGRKVFNQETMFPLVEALKKALTTSETIMSLADHQAANKCDAWKAIDVSEDGKVEWKTRLYAVYRKGFERDLNMPLGETVVWVEKGVPYTFEVPNVQVTLINPDGSSTKVNLREAPGLAVFDVYKYAFLPKLTQIGYNKNMLLLYMESFINTLRH